MTKELTSIKQRVLKDLLQVGFVLINHTQGKVYLKNNKQVKLDIGIQRGNRDFEFSNPRFWRKCSDKEAFLIKSRLYKLGELLNITFLKVKY